jgi:hypothetical protein
MVRFTLKTSIASRILTTTDDPAAPALVENSMRIEEILPQSRFKTDVYFLAMEISQGAFFLANQSASQKFRV